MSRDASGTYTAPSNSANPAVNGTVIDPDDHNDMVDDLETALSESVFTGGSSGTDNAVVRADGTSGKKVQEAGVTIDDSDNVAGVGNFTLGGYIDISEAATPADPAANTMRIYCADNGGTTELHFVDSAGNDVNLNNLNGTVTSVGITNPAAGITSSGGPITSSGSITLALANDLAALEALSSTGIAERTGSDTWQLTTTAALLEDVGSTQGQILYRDGSAWTVLSPGSVGQLLQTGGPGADPSWATVSGAGDVTAASAFATDNVVIRADGTGKGVQLSGLSIDDSDNLTGVNNVTGADANFVTGTAGTSANLVSWDANGDAVDAGYNIPTGGSIGQALTKASAADHDLEWATASGGGTAGTVQTFSSSGTYTKPAGLVWARVTAVGPGGGGGGADGGGSGTSAAGGGGGAGGVAVRILAAASIGSTETVTIGAGGAGGSIAGTDGSDGAANTTFGALVTATPGSGGKGNNAPNSNFSARDGGDGGSTSGTISYTGFSLTGQRGLRNAIVAMPGAGGSCSHGNGGGSVVVGAGTSTGSDGTRGGGGAGGGASSSTSPSGGAGGTGGDGYVIVEEFY
jgi:hypothetical protein